MAGEVISYGKANGNPVTVPLPTAEDIVEIRRLLAELDHYRAPYVIIPASPDPETGLPPGIRRGPGGEFLVSVTIAPQQPSSIAHGEVG